MFEVTDDTFDQDVLRADTPIVLDFWAPWCGPCRKVEPILEQLETELRGAVEFAKVNVDENPRMMSEFRIRGIPTLILFKDGQPVETLVGFMPEKAILDKVKKHID